MASFRRSLAVLATSAALTLPVVSAPAFADIHPAPGATLHPEPVAATGRLAPATISVPEGQDCPTGSTKVGADLAAYDGATAPSSNVAPVTDEGSTNPYWSATLGSAPKIFHVSPDVPLETVRYYVRLKVRGDFAEKQVAISRTGGGGFYLTPADRLTKPVPTTEWRAVTFDLTDAMSEGTPRSAGFEIDLLGTGGQRVDLDDLRFYRCSPVSTGEAGSLNGDKLADAKFVAPSGALIAVSGRLPGRTGGVEWLVGTGLQGADWIGTPGDLDGDGHADLMVRFTNGELYALYGDGVRSIKGSRLIGTGWQDMTAILTPGPLLGGATTSVIARDRAGNMWRYEYGASVNRFSSDRALVGTGWQFFRQIFPIRNYATPTTAELYAVAPNGDLKTYVLTSRGMSGWGTRIGSGWDFPKINSIGDFDGDGIDDVLGVSAAGEAWVYAPIGGGTWKDRVSLGGGWVNPSAIG